MLVIDANMVIAALLKDGKARQIIVSEKFAFVSPDYLIEELDKYRKDIAEKAGVSEKGLAIVEALLLKRIKIVPYDEYRSKIGVAKGIMLKDAKDVPYAACYLALKCEGIWTNDSDFDGNKYVKVITTAYLMSLL